MILLPTLNESQNIEKVILNIRKVIPDEEIVVVDGLSNDGTADIAKKLGVKVILEPKKGKGHAVKKAFEELDSEYIIMLDADLTYPVEKIPKIIEELKNNDVVMGSRFLGIREKGAMPLIKEIGNRIISFWASLLYLKWTSDICTGMWGFRKSMYKNINIDAPGFEIEANLFADSCKKNLKIKEIPIDYFCRGGESKVQLIDGVKVCLFLLKKRF